MSGELKRVFNKKAKNPITSLHKQHLSHMVIGLIKIIKKSTLVHAYKLYRTLKSYSREWIMIEFIKGIAKNIATAKQETVYLSLLNQAIKMKL
jgi:hypothetical protein